MQKQSIEILDSYKELIEKSLSYYSSDSLFLSCFRRIPLSRYHTMKYCYEQIDHDFKPTTIVELGTSRSFVDGRFPGCNENNTTFWEPNDPSKWDWSAGCFTRLTGMAFNHIHNFLNFHTVDLSLDHINRCKFMNSDLSNINYHVSSSEYFLANFPSKIDLLYLDTGDMTPISSTALLHLREAEIIVGRDLMKPGGIILIDDIRSCVPFVHNPEEYIDLGKGYLSIPYFLNNGFELIMDEYQTVLKKM